MKPFTPNPKQTLKNYYEVPVDIVESSDHLVEWAVAAAHR
jgi:DNA transformation protein